VPGGALGRRHPRFDHVADQGMDEAEGLLGQEDAGLDHRGRGGGDLLGGEPDQRARLPRRASVTEDGGRGGERFDVRPQLGQPPADRLRDRAGRAARRRARGGGDPARQLAQQEGVAGRFGVEAGDEVVGGLPAQLLAEQAPGRRFAERGRPEEGRRGAVGERGQQLRVHLGFAGPPGRHQEDRQILEPAGEVDEEAEARLVGPLHVVDAEQQGPGGGEVRGQPVEPVEEREGLVVGRRRRLDAQRHRRRARRLGEQPLACRRLGAGELPLEHAPGDAERKIPLQLGAGRPVDGHAPRARRLDRDPEQGGLADPGRARDRHQAAARRGRPVERAVQDIYLPIPLEERTACRSHRLILDIERRPVPDGPEPI
jgi:hypothetical protein